MVKPYFGTKLGKLYCNDCLRVLLDMPDESIDLTITSPPYDNLRTYKGYRFNFEGVANELYRVTKKGGIVVWIRGDSVVKKSETANSFKQSLFFKEIGFNLHDTMIYQKDASPFPESNRYNQCFEYMFIFLKGNLKVFNPIKERTIWNKPRKPTTRRLPDGSLEYSKYKMGKQEKIKGNIWSYSIGFNKSTKDKIAFDHPAIFPEKLAEDHIISWSNEGDTLFDPMAGSGTTLKMAERFRRNWIGIEISDEYCNIIKKRIMAETRQLTIT